MKTSFTKLLLLAAMLLPLTGWAQEVVLTDVSPRGYDGVKSLDGKSFYTFYFGEKTDNKGMANFALELFDQDLKRINTTNIELKKGSELAGSSFNGNNFLFVFVDWARKSLTMVTLDKQGKIIEQKEQVDVKRSLLDADNYSNILAVENDFVIIKPLKEKKFGFTVERLDNKLNVKWTKEFASDDKAIFALESRSANNKVYILTQEKPNRTADKFEDFIVCLDPANGNEIYSYSLFDGESTGWPSSLVIDDKGNVATSGMYFKGEKFDDVNSDGLFFLAIDATGKKLAYNKTPWKEIIDQIKDENSGLLLGGKTKTMVQDIILKKDGSYMVVAETFRKSNNADNTGDVMTKTALKMGGLSNSKSSSSAVEEEKIGFTVMDFIFFSYDNQGKLTNIKKVRKEPRSVVITGRLTSETGMAIGMEMKNMGYFTYQYMLEHNGGQYLVYRDYDGMKQKAYFLDVNADDTKEVPAIDMNKNIDEDLNKTVKGLSKLSGNSGSQMEYNSSANQWERGTSMRWKGIVTAKPGHMLMYEYRNMQLNMWLVKLPM